MQPIRIEIIDAAGALVCEHLFSTREVVNKVFGHLLRDYPRCEIRMREGDALLMSVGPAPVRRVVVPADR